MGTLEEYKNYLEQRGLTQRTIEEHIQMVSHFEKYINGRGATAIEEQIRTYWIKTAETCESTTAYKKTASVFYYYKWLVDTGTLLVNPAPAPIPQQTNRLPKVLPEQKQLKEIIENYYESDSLYENRNALIIDMAYSGGLRLGELQRLNLNDIDLKEGTVRVKGKGGSERVVPIGQRCLDHLFYYIKEVRPRLATKNETPALFVTDHQPGRITVKGMKTLFSRLKEKHPAIKAHALRHAFATDLLRNGAPLQDISKMLGHMNMETTQIYTRLTITDLKEQHQKFHPRG